MSERRRAGLLFGVGAYGMWGLFPAFFLLLKPAGAGHHIAHAAPPYLACLPFNRSIRSGRPTRLRLLRACLSVLAAGIGSRGAR